MRLADGVSSCTLPSNKQYGIRTCRCRCLEAVSGLTGTRIPGLTGVWVDGQKVAAIGIRVQKWISYHGIAINLTTDLDPFSLIVPCGIADRSVASVESLTCCNMPAQELMQEYIVALTQAFEEVFDADTTVGA